MPEKILVVDDDESIRLTLETALAYHDYQVETAASGEEAIQKAEKDIFDLLVTDLKMDRMDGIATYRVIKEIHPGIVAIIVTGHASLNTAIEALRSGIYDYVVKPFKIDEVVLRIRHALENARLVKENAYLHRELEERYGWENIVGKNERMLEIYRLVKRVAQSDTTVLLRGESGTGKELIARALHFSSPRRNKRFVAISCGALPETLLESELFGYEKGAFTGALSRKKGLFEIADEGTLFLDEVGDLSLATQMKLLRAIQQQEFQRVGGTATIRVNVRVVSATNKDLEEAVKRGDFREDLYYRLNVVPVHLPPLRERRDDIPLLVQHFLEKYRHKRKYPVGFTAEAEELLLKYNWPGNVRELENVIERTVVLVEGKRITVKDLPVQINQTTVRRVKSGEYTTINSFQAAREQFEKDYLIHMLEKNHGNVSLTARQVGLSRRYLYEKISQYGIDINKERGKT